MKRVVLLVVVLGLVVVPGAGAGASQGAPRLSRHAGEEAIRGYVATAPNARPLLCVRRSARSIACKVEWPEIQVGESLDPQGEWVPAYATFYDLVVAKAMTSRCVKVWEPLFRPKYAKTVCD